MGQRLVIHMMNDFDEEIANAYYHWSAYTSSSLSLLKLIADALKLIQEESTEKWAVTDYTNRVYHTKIDSLNDHELATILLYATGAGLRDTKESIEVLCKNDEKRLRIPAISSIDRNEGLIELTKEGMDNSCTWSEGDAYVYIRSGDVEFEVLNYISFDDAEKCEINLEEIEEMNEEIDLFEFNLKDIGKIKELVSNLPLKTYNGIIDSYE